MTTRKAAWTLVALSYPCPTCDARAGEDCVTRTGRPTRGQVHVPRGQDVKRCPRCGARLPADDEPGALCSRCALVRALEVERSTTYRRRS